MPSVHPHEAVVLASLFDENLSKFRHNLKTITPTAVDTKCFYRLRKSLTDIFANEGLRCNAFMDVLREGIIPAGSILRGRGLEL